MTVRGRARVSRQPVSISFDATHEGAHVRVVVRAGVAGSRALCGELLMRPGEWSLLRWLLATSPPLLSNESYIPDFAKGRATVMFHTPIDMNPVEVNENWMDEVMARAARSVVSKERVPCGPTGDETFCACGCGGDDSRCDYWLDMNELGSEVDDEHTCCKVLRRGATVAADEVGGSASAEVEAVDGFREVRDPEPR